MPPPRLSAASAERMKAVVTTADQLVDSGTEPNTAIAKAAQEHALPHNHIDMVVRAFNTGRSVLQLGANTPWEKAADHPTASREGVLAVLTAPVSTKAAEDLSDYFQPPAATEWRPDPYVLPKLAAAKPEPAPVVEKVASAPRIKARDSRLSHERELAHAYDAAIDAIVGLPPRTYEAVKKAAQKYVPDVAAFFYPRVEAEFVQLVKRAGQTFLIDPTITIDHPGIQALHKLAAIKAAYVVEEAESTPHGYEKISEYGGVPFYRKLPICPIFGTPIAAASEKVASTPEPAPVPQEPFGFTVPTDEAAEQFVKQNGFWGGLSETALKAPTYLAVNPVTKPVIDATKMRYLSPPKFPKPEGYNTKELKDVVEGLPGDFDRINQQAALQDVLVDPRFAKADPKTLVDTYRDLSSIAPRVMANKSVASDFLTRRLQTGSLSYYDIKSLVDMEKSMSDIAKNDRLPVTDV